MTLKSSLYYWIVCDYPGCGTSAAESSEYTAWGDVSQAFDQANDSDWLVKEDGTAYCDFHTIQTECESPEDCPEHGELCEEIYIKARPTDFAGQLESVLHGITSNTLERLDRISRRLRQQGQRDRMDGYEAMLKATRS